MEANKRRQRYKRTEVVSFKAMYRTWMIPLQQVFRLYTVNLNIEVHISKYTQDITIVIKDERDNILSSLLRKS